MKSLIPWMFVGFLWGSNSMGQGILLLRPHGTKGPDADRLGLFLAQPNGGGGGGAGGSGNGGIEVRDDFYIPLGKEVLSFLREDPVGLRLVLVYDLPIHELEKAVEPDSVEVSFAPVHDKTGSEVDAALIDGKTRLYERAWREFASKKRAMYRLVFHEMLRHAGVDDDGNRISAAVLNDTNEVTFDPKFGVDLFDLKELRDSALYVESPLGRAALAGQLTSVRLLLAAGLDPNLHPLNGEWPAEHVALVASVQYANDLFLMGLLDVHGQKAETLVNVLLDAGAKFWDPEDFKTVLSFPSLSTATTCRLLRVWAETSPRPLDRNRLATLIRTKQARRPKKEVAELLRCVDQLR